MDRHTGAPLNPPLIHPIVAVELDPLNISADILFLFVNLTDCCVFWVFLKIIMFLRNNFYLCIKIFCLTFSTANI